MKLSIVDLIALVLTIIGAVNWGLVGALDVDLVRVILGSSLVLVKLVYIVVGIAGIYSAYIVYKLAK